MTRFRNHLTHPYAVEIHEHSRGPRRGTLIGLQLFTDKEAADYYAEAQADASEGETWCHVRRTRSDDREFA